MRKGLLCTADLAGYRTALRYAQEQMHGFGLRGEQMAELLQSSVIRQFDIIFSQLGVSQIRALGDGFMAAFPKRVFPDAVDVITGLIGYWRAFLETLERLNKDIRDPTLAAAYAQCAGRLDDLSEHLVFHGRMPLDAKELRWEARVYGLPLPPPGGG